MSVLAFDDPLGSRLILSLWPSPPTKLQKLEPINATEIAFSSCFISLLTKFDNDDGRLIQKMGNCVKMWGWGGLCVVRPEFPVCHQLWNSKNCNIGNQIWNIPARKNQKIKNQILENFFQIVVQSTRTDSLLNVSPGDWLWAVSLFFIRCSIVVRLLSPKAHSEQIYVK